MSEQQSPEEPKSPTTPPKTPDEEILGSRWPGFRALFGLNRAEKTPQIISPTPSTTPSDEKGVTQQKAQEALDAMPQYQIDIDESGK
jgi:hypothetical protein